MKFTNKAVLIIAIALFVIQWELPLFFTPGSLLRSAIEEMRVLVTGMFFGFVLFFLWKIDGDTK